MFCETEVKDWGVGKIIWLKSSTLRAGLTTLGAAIQSVQYYHPEEKRWIEVTLGFSTSPEDSAVDTDYGGVTVGRCSGRISNARFTLDNKEYHTEANMPTGHTCHSGTKAYHKKQWGFTVIEDEKSIGVRFRYVSPHMDNGFPAEVENTVYYYIERANPSALHTNFDAWITETSPADATVVNIFHHPIYNLNGVEHQAPGAVWKQPVSGKNHLVRIPASKVADTDPAAIPTGHFSDVAGTSLDFRKYRRISDGLMDKATLNRDPSGYDHPLLIDGWEKGKMQLNAEVVSPITGIKMTVCSTYPCLWLYTATFKPQPAPGTPDKRWERYAGVYVEPQYFPDSPNRPEFPSVVIRRGQSTFSEKKVNSFSIDHATAKL